MHGVHDALTSSHKYAFSENLLYLCPQINQIMKEMRVAFSDMWSTGNRNRVLAAESNSRKSLNQPMIRVRIKTHTADYTIRPGRMYFDCIIRRNYMTTCSIEFRRQVIDTIAFFEVKICDIINAAGTAGKAGSSCENRYAVNSFITIDNDT